MAINKRITSKASSNKLLKKQRVMHYFIEAALEIANETGMNSLTIRNVADRAGYYSASLYNYFENLDQLKCYTALYLLDECLGKLSEIQREDADVLEKYISSCKSFCNCAFKNPSVYSFILRPANMESIIGHFEEYSSYFADKSDNAAAPFTLELLNGSFRKSGNILLVPCIDAGYIAKRDMDSLAEFAALLFEGLLLQAMQNGNSEEFEEFTDMFLEYYFGYFNTKLKKEPSVSYKAFLEKEELERGVQLAFNLKELTQSIVI